MTVRKAAKIVWAVIGGVAIIVGLFAELPELLQTYFGITIESGSLFGWLKTNSDWLLPLSCFVFGIVVGVGVGWFVRGRNLPEPDEDIASLKDQLTEKDVRIEELEAQVQQYGSDAALLHQQVDDLEQALADNANARSMAQEHEEKEQELSKLNSLSPIQLQCILHCLCEESVGVAGIRRPPYDATACSLVDAGVFEQYSTPSSKLDRFVFTPKWRLFATENENNIRVMLGEEPRIGGLPVDPDGFGLMSKMV